MTSAYKRYPTHPRPVTHFVVAQPESAEPPPYRDWRAIYCLDTPQPTIKPRSQTHAVPSWRYIYMLTIPAIPAQVCPKCHNTGSVPYNGRHIRAMICECAAGDRLIEDLYAADVEAMDDRAAIAELVG